MARPNPYRHPLGRSCRKALPLAILLTLFYALPRYAWDCWKERP